MAPPRAPVPRLLLLLALLAATAAVQASDFESEFATARRNLQAAELKIVRYEFLFNPKSCYSAKTRPCKVLKRTYRQIDTLPTPWPPAALNPGEYLTHVVGVTNTNKRVQIASQLMAVGTRPSPPPPSPPPRPPPRSPPPPPQPPARPGRPGGKGGVGSGVSIPANILPRNTPACNGGFCGFTPANVKISEQAMAWLPAPLKFLDPSGFIESFLYQIQVALCNLFLSGSAIRSGLIPALPASLNPIKAWFGPLPLQNSVYYIAGGVMASFPMSMSIDSSGATPGVGQGIVFAFNPCREEYHFGFVGLSTPKVNIPPLGIAVSAQPIGVSVSNKGEIPSDHDAIGMTDAFWVGANKDKEKRVVQGNLYITGSITVEPIVQQSDKVTIGVVGDGKAVISWTGGRTESIYKVETIPTITIFDIVSIAMPSIATVQVYTGVSDMFRFRLRARFPTAGSPPLPNLLGRINGIPQFVKEGIADLFSGGGYGNDARCNSGNALSVPEFDIFADGDSKSWGVRAYVCVNAVSMVFMGQPVLGALVANAFPVVNQGSEFSLFRSDNRFGVSVSGINLYFCETNSNCPSNQYCAATICVPANVFAAVVKAISSGYNTVSAETQKLYDDTLEEAQGFPNAINEFGKDIGNFICQKSVCNSSAFKDALDKLNIPPITVVTKPVVNVVNSAKKKLKKIFG